MHPFRALGFSLPLAVWLFAAGLSGGGLHPAVPGAQAQGSLTAPAGQSRVTAPGGLRGKASGGLRVKAARRHRTHRRR